MSTSTKPPIWYWIVSVIALIWNLMGVINYLAQAFMKDEMLASMTKEQRIFIENRPAWATGAFAVAVWAGLIGCLLLLIRKKQAFIVLVISFVGVVVQMIHSFFIANAMDVYGPGGLIMPIMILIIGIGLILLAKKGETVGWLK